jgi:hypothetical protein
VHYDPQKDKLVVFSIPMQKALDMRERSGFEQALGELRGLEHSEAERRVEAALLQLVESLSGSKLRLRDYQAELEGELEKWIADAEKAPGVQTPEAQYDLAIAYHDLALRRKSQELMAKARALIESSAKGGVAKAVRDLEHWDIYERQFERRLRQE